MSSGVIVLLERYRLFNTRLTALHVVTLLVLPQVVEVVLVDPELEVVEMYYQAATK